MIIALLLILLFAVLYLYGRSVSNTLAKSAREMGIYMLVLLSLAALVVLFLTANTTQ